MSLSNRLRVDAERMDDAHNRGALNSPQPNLPKLKKQNQKGKSQPNEVSQATQHQPFALQSLNETHIRQTFQRLSASYDSEAVNCAYPERNVSKYSSALCVRCSELASLCVQCSESLTATALNFYKETRARGAMSLFANAITQAGAAKLLRFVLFHIWKNSFNQRSRIKHKKIFIAERRHRRSILIGPYTAWRHYISSNRLRKKDKEVSKILTYANIFLLYFAII